jgi:rhodanese-related sulfurtransferase
LGQKSGADHPEIDFPYTVFYYKRRQVSQQRSDKMVHSPGFLKLVEEARKQIQECSIAEVKERAHSGPPFHFIDVREDREFAVDHAAGARHIGRGVLERDVEDLIPDRDAEIVLYCGGGFRSALATYSLQKMGYTRVTSMAGGIRAWREAGYPMEK